MSAVPDLLSPPRQFCAAFQGAANEHQADRMTTQDLDPSHSAALDDLLMRWWSWKPRIQPARGHGSVALGFESFRVTRQYDDQNGALYEDEEEQIMRAVEREVNFLETHHRTVIYVMARALTMGVLVFSSPRLPSDRVERERLVKQARGCLAARLISSGLM